MTQSANGGIASDGLAGTAMAGRLVRYADLVPCRTAFIDTRTPGSTEKENFTIIGPGVSESPDQFVHIAQPHGFNIGGARQPFGCVNSQHSHETAEVFVVHSGHWRLLFGPNCEDGSLEIGPGDVASVPTQMFRGFEKVDEGTGFLWVALGQDEPGKVTWAPAVLEAAADFGLKLTKGGQLIDTSSGDYELRDVELETGLDAEAAAQLRTPPLEKLLQCVVRAGEAPANPDSPLAAPGVVEAGVIVPQATNDGFAPGPISGWWPHGFNLRQLTLQTGAYVPLHARAEEEVIFIQSGTLEVSWADGSLIMGAGDTLTVPIGLQHGFRNTASVPCEAIVVRGSEDPARPVFASQG
ncbi:cupin domain-containing protein [Novosphingobium terrae]|uniref:cupin domain-containing protein n=1 Tax=Novosphingobium terrae TaxID=2726189 RepID=UPI001F12CC8A|nr:cupin domain-containing protein [Novosphingobium terrae]